MSLTCWRITRRDSLLTRPGLLTGTFLGLALAAVRGGALIAAHRASRPSQLPLGAFMLAGALAAIVLLRV